MQRTIIFNLCLFVAACTAAFFLFSTGNNPVIPDNKIATAGDSIIEQNAAGEPCIRDAGGVLVPVHAYQHIVSLSSSVDAWLIKCVGPERIHAYCSYSNEKPYAEILQGKKHFADAKDIEGLIQSGGDLIIMPTMGGNVSVVNRLREAGLTVFNIGDMSGFEAFCRSAKEIAWLCKVPVAGDALLSEFKGKMKALSTRIPRHQQKTALYIGVFGDQLYGGTRGSSYHDVLHAAGLRDSSVEARIKWSSAWPQYSSEQLLLMSPDYLVTQTGMAVRIAAVPGMNELDAVKQGRIIEIEPYLINDAGLLMYETVATLQRQVYGSTP